MKADDEGTAPGSESESRSGSGSGSESGSGSGSESESGSGSGSGTRKKRKTTIPGFPAVPVPARRTKREAQSLRMRVSAFLRSAESRASQSSRKRWRFSLYLVRLAVQVVRQWARDRCPQQAASLAFQTVLSVVPVLAVCLAALRVTGLIDAQSALMRFLSERLIPVSSTELAQKLTEWSEKITFQSLGLIGLVTTGLI
ncbi:MAG TPA: YhjD/YihY/BrkB family envelope integrity protein, partial [Kofleriaceae bacterium]